MKECKVIGYQECIVKDSQEEMFRICITVKADDEKYRGEKAVYIFLPKEEKLKIDLDNYLDKKYYKCTYETTDNIISGKTKVTKLNFS